jgi:hypothetical protein
MGARKDSSMVEFELKRLWNHYVQGMENSGSAEDAKRIRNQYFNLYRCYRQNKQRLKIITNNQKGGPS